MKSTATPEPRATLQELSDVAQLIYEAIEVGAQEARDYFDKLKRPVEPHLAASLVRYHAGIHIDQKAPNIGDLIREPLANNGLQVRYKNTYDIKVLKSDDGEVPAPGPSKKKQAFYHQEAITGWAEIVGEDGPDGVNLILVWEVTRNYLMMGLTLACPKSGTAAYRSTKLHWELPVPHKATTLRPPEPQQDETSIGTIPDEDDLPITKNPSKTGTDSADA